MAVEGAEEQCVKLKSTVAVALSLGRLRKLVAVIICCFVLATGYIAFVIAERQTALQKFARYNDSWAVSQTVAEYLRLQTSSYF